MIQSLHRDVPNLGLVFRELPERRYLITKSGHFYEDGTFQPINGVYTAYKNMGTQFLDYELVFVGGRLKTVKDRSYAPSR
jgi:hypothetical protein